jgi:hypothetical protein
LKTVHPFILLLLIFLSSVKLCRANSTEGFVENKGQVLDQRGSPNPTVKYFLKGTGMNVQLKSNGFSYDTYSVEQNSVANSRDGFKNKLKNQPNQSLLTCHFHRIDVSLIDANLTAQIVTSSASETYLNYFTKGTPVGGISNVHSYRQIVYKNIYPNIDLEFISDTNNWFKYNFIVRPGGDYKQIKLLYKGADEIRLSSGKILMSTDNGDLNEQIPKSYEAETGHLLKVDYVGLEKNEFGFFLNGNYDKLHTLVIDPSPNIVWGSYLGGIGHDIGNAIATDSTGNIFIVGTSISESMAIATSGAYKTTADSISSDVFVAKMNTSGTVKIWATYYGGPGNDSGIGITLDANDNVYLTGNTGSLSGIATTGAYQASTTSATTFIAKFNSTGTALLWGTYYAGQGYGYNLVIDNSNNVYVTGITKSMTGIATGNAYQKTFGGGAWDGFIAKFNATGSVLLWGTYFGGGGDDESIDIAIDNSRNIYITGFTNSSNGLSTAGAYQTVGDGSASDAFIAKFDSTGSSLIWGTYYGKAGYDKSLAIAIDGGKNVYITGSTSSHRGLATSGAYLVTMEDSLLDNIFVAKFNSSGSSLLWGTYYGGLGSDDSWDIITDASNNVYITGITSSSGGIATSGAYQINYNSNQGNAFIAKFNPTGNSLLWGTYFGGSTEAFANGIVLDPVGNLYIGGMTNCTSGIATTGSAQTIYGGGTFNAFAAKFNNPGGTGVLETNSNPISATVYPNPSSGAFTIHISGLLPHGSVEIGIINVLGQQILSETREITSEIMDERFEIQGASGGLYFISVRIGSINVVKKIAIQN